MKKPIKALIIKFLFTAVLLFSAHALMTTALPRMDFHFISSFVFALGMAVVFTYIFHIYPPKAKSLDEKKRTSNHKSF